MKKKIFLMMILSVAMLYAPNVFAVSINGCSSVLPNVDIDIKIVNAVHTIITVIKIAVPVILVVFGMLDLMKGVMAQKEDEIKKGQHIFIKRLIAAILIFFVTSIVQLLVSFVADDQGGNIMDCANCFINGAEDDGTCKK